MRTSFSIFVRFRRGRLTMVRGIPDQGEALRRAEAMRLQRPHDREAIFVVDDGTGEVVEGPALALGSLGSLPSLPSLPPEQSPDDRAAELPSPPRAAPRPVVAPEPVFLFAPAPPELPRQPRLSATVRRQIADSEALDDRAALARRQARAARALLEQALARWRTAVGR